MGRITGCKCVVGTDLDYTKITFDHSLGGLNQARVVASVTGGSPECIQKELEAIGKQLIFKNTHFIQRVEAAFDAHVSSVGERLEERLWSTAARILVYLAEAGYDPARYYAKAVEAEAGFWGGVSQLSKLYDDAVEFRETLRLLGLPVFALTSSDARTQLVRDASGAEQIRYEVEHSIRLKHLRLKPSGIFDLISPEDVVVSDPWPKEDLRVWKARVFPRYPDRPDREHWVFLGDTSYDMHAALVAGIGTRIYIERHLNAKRPSEATHVVSSLAEAGALIEELVR